MAALVAMVMYATMIAINDRDYPSSRRAQRLKVKR